MSVKTATKYAWKQKFEHIQLAPPVKDTVYTVLQVVGGARLRQLRVNQENTEAAAKNVQVSVTTDTTVSVDTSALDSGATYSYNRDYEDGLTKSGAGDSNTFGQFSGDPTMFVDSHILTVKITFTSVAGTAQTLDYYIVYDKLEAV